MSDTVNKKGLTEANIWTHNVVAERNPSQSNAPRKAIAVDFLMKNDGANPPIAPAIRKNRIEVTTFRFIRFSQIQG